MKVTIRDIAKYADVSVSTVSKVLNGKDHDIGVATKERVMRIIQEHQYTPNRLAQSMITGQTQTIGLIIPDIRNSFFTELARGVEDEAKKNGYSVILCNTDDDLKNELQYLKVLIDKQVDGLILAPSAEREGEKESAIGVRVPMVLVDRDVNYQNIVASIQIDNLIGSYLATKYLIAQGHQDIAIYTGPRHVSTSKTRWQGYNKALLECGLTPNKELDFSGDFRGLWVSSTLDKLLKQTVTAVICANDLIAIELMQGLQQLGVKVPDQISVVGFDDIPSATLVRPRLSTVRQPSYELGQKAVQELVRNLKVDEAIPSNHDRDKSESVRSLILMPELILRESSSSNSHTKSK